MSMHQMESLVECSVVVLARADPIPADARDLCYSLYELQDRFDCGYTVLRVREELTGLGYLYPLPPDRLPEAERAGAAALDGQAGFIGDDPQIYFDAGSGLAYVTAGSPVWEKLCRAGQFTGADALPVRPLPVLEVAGRIAALAVAQEDEPAAQAMGLWYALYPAFLAMDSDGEDALSPQELALRDRLATPEALAFAAGWRLLPTSDEMERPEELDPIEGQWLEPYRAIIFERRAKAALEAAYRRIEDAIEARRFSEALELAAALPEEPDRAYYRAFVSLSFQRLRGLCTGDAPGRPDGILSLAEAERTFAALLGTRPERDHLCHINRFLCLTLLNRRRQGFDSLKAAFLPQLELLRRTLEDDWQRRFGEAALSVLFYSYLYENLPGTAPEKQRLLRTRAGDLPLPGEAEKMFCALAGERQAQAWACRYHAGLCRMLQGDPDGALRELREADRLHPGKPEIREALEQVSKLPGGAGR